MARDARAIFQRGVLRPVETWLDQHSRRVDPGNYYYVGGNSKFYDAVLIRYRERDFAALEHWDGVSTAWPHPLAEALRTYIDAAGIADDSKGFLFRTSCGQRGCRGMA